MATRDVLATAWGWPVAIAPRVEAHAGAGGVVELAPSSDHRLWVHVGAPVGVECGLGVRFVASRGDVDFFPARRPAAWREEGAARSVVLALPDALLRSTAVDLGLDPDRAELAPRYRFRDERIEHVVLALDAERRAGGPGGLLYAESLGVAVAAHLLRDYAPPAGVRPRPPAGLSATRLGRVVEYVDAHLDGGLSLGELAAVAGLSVSHFKAQFKRATGLAAHAYVVRRRVERAKALLARGDLPSSQIAIEVGFSHQSHMARCMRRVLGVTPSAVARARGPRGRRR